MRTCKTKSIVLQIFDFTQNNSYYCSGSKTLLSKAYRTLALRKKFFTFSGLFFVSSICSTICMRSSSLLEAGSRCPTPSLRSLLTNSSGLSYGEYAGK